MKIICPRCLSVNNVPQKESYIKANCGACKESLLVPKIVHVNASNIDKILQNSDIPVVVDFWAPWCGPCKMMGPIFEECALLFPLKALFVKINTQDEQFLASRFKIRSIPTIAIFKNSKEIQRVSGAMSIDDLENFVKRHI